MPDPTGEVCGLPEADRAAARSTFDAMERAVVAAFGDADAPIPRGAVLTRLERLGLSELKEHLPLDALPSARAYAGLVREQAERNPLLVAAAAAWPALPDDVRAQVLPAGPERAAGLREAVEHGVFLEVVTAALVAHEDHAGGRSLLGGAVDAVRSRSEEVDWQAHASAFERLKVASLFQGMAVDAAYHHDLEAFRTIREYGGIFLQINILEAMGQDVVSGRRDNAEAALPMVVHTSGRRALSGLDNGPIEPAAWADATHLPERRPPLPRAWTRLYHAWNLCFVASYPDAPSYMVKLLTPCVARACEDKPGVYLHLRGTALFLHLLHELFLRAEGRSAPTDLGTSHLQPAWGALNRRAGDRYDEAVREALRANNPVRARLWEGARRRFVRGLWRSLSLTLTGAAALR